MIFFWVRDRRNSNRTAITLLSGSEIDLNYFRHQGFSWTLDIPNISVGQFFTTEASAISFVEDLEMTVFEDSPSFGTFAV